MNAAQLKYSNVIPLVFPCLLLLRLIIIVMTRMEAASSYVLIIIEGSKQQTSPQSIIIWTVLQVLLAFFIEIVFTLQISDDSNKSKIISELPWKRLLVFELILLLGEFFLYLNLQQEMNVLTSIPFIQNLASGTSFFSLYLHPSSYATYWFAISCYIAAMVFILFPRNDSTQQRIELSASILFLRSIFLPF